VSDQREAEHVPGVFRHLSHRDIAEGIDGQLATSALVLPPQPAPEAGDRADKEFQSTVEFWRAILSERVRARRTVVLHEVFLSEWFPRSPGLYHTGYARAARTSAREHVMHLSEEQQALYDASRPPDPVVYDLYGKLEMLRGGIGCIRLNRRITPDGALWFMSCSSSLSAEQGVPLALTDSDYERVIDDVTENGVLSCRVTGKVMVLPDSLLSLYHDYSGVPRLYVLVEALVPDPSADRLRTGRPTANVAVMFTADEPWPAVNATYIDFVPGQNGNLAQRLPWLEYYVGELYGGTVVTDFDEQMTRFPHAVFSLQKVASASLNESELQDVGRYLHLSDTSIQQLLTQQRQYGFTINKIRIEAGEVHVGDVFSNIGAGAVIINRSTLINALNNIQAKHGQEATRALEELADAVRESGNPEAIDNLNGLTEELEKPQPSKNRLRTWLDAIASVLPDVAAVTGAVATLAGLLL
jgi:hypothetical protein